MYQYSIYRINYGGRPFILDFFDSFESCYSKLMSYVVQCENDRDKYYVDNDFFDNKYILAYDSMYYFKILVRKISSWEEYYKDFALIDRKNNNIFSKKTDFSDKVKIKKRKNNVIYISFIKSFK